MLEQLLTIPTSDVNIQRRGKAVIAIALVMLGLILAGGLVVIFRSERGPSALALAITGLVIVGAIIMARRGMVGAAAWALVLMITAAVVAAITLRPGITSVLFYLSLPLVIAGVVLQPRQVGLVLALELLIVLAKAQISPLVPMSRMEVGVLVANSYLILSTLGAISFLSARIASQAFHEAATARRAAEESAQRLAELNANLEGQVAAQTAELRAAFVEAEARANEKQALLDEIASQRELIRAISVPVLPVSDDTLVMPLIGDIDSARMHTIQAQALAALERSRARTLLIDLTGVAVIDVQVAQGLLRTVQSARLLGASPVLIGIRPEVAQSIVSLGIDLGEVRTAASLASALSL